MPFGLGPFGWSFCYPYLRLSNFFLPGYQPWYPYYWVPWASMSKEDEIRMLEDQAKGLKEQLKEVNRRLQELRK